MSLVSPNQVIESMIQSGEAKAKLPVRDLLIRGALSGALLGFGTTLAFTAEVQTGMGIVGAVLFPAAFVIIILLGLELVTGSFALLPVAVLGKKATVGQMIRNWLWVIVGHILGSIIYALLYIIAITQLGHVNNNPVAAKIITVAETKTLGYKNLGTDGLIVVFVKAMLCNWMVTLGAVMAMTTKSVGGKIAAMWLPILIFFAQGFEHAVVNMFVIPAGMMLGAHVTLADWLLWNQLPVTVGNLFGGFLFTGLALYLTHGKTASKMILEVPKTGKTAASR
ncbi:formate transporter [Bacillus sp. AFS076308]|uniref:formate/nitrite transporter family protein n=1 Tax=unclassified Bacillus (in: firmicutes) TaxID=185979 RepID=UPI000BF6CA39|nr:MULTISPECIES: formate/nitrite transporter family protein [unclassified Bacillus (in: firmicutes)]PFN76444.1 formate transporter [Bacillus sp. AFS076308]PGV54839.1 formate transporter [Bacillus sp. AFS037270]